jgi:hypothetical protein
MISCCALTSSYSCLTTLHASFAKVSQASSKDADRAGSYVREQQDQEQQGALNSCERRCLVLCT